VCRGLGAVIFGDPVPEKRPAVEANCTCGFELLLVAALVMAMALLVDLGVVNLAEAGNTV
jgi:hypothetical protein